MTECQTKSSVSIWVTIAIAIVSFIMMLITIIYSMMHLKKVALSSASTQKEIKITSNNKTSQNRDKSEWEKASGCVGKFKLCIKDILRRKTVYLPLIAHISDTTTDFAAVVEFGFVATTSKDCGVNVWYLFSLSIICMLLYRLVSGYKVYQLTGSLSRAFSQFFDMELYRILYLSHIYDLTAKSSPQRLLAVLEAVFEAAPQSLIQMVFLLFTGNKSGVVISSAMFSFFNLTRSITVDDAKMLGIEMTCPVCEQTRDTKDDGHVWMRYKGAEYLLLYLYRLMDIPSKILSFVFLWYFVHGALCFGFVMLDLCISIFMYHKTKNTDALLSVVAVPFSFGSDKYQHLNASTFRYLWYAIIETIVIFVIICSFAEFKGKPTLAIILWIFCSIGMISKWIILWKLARIYYYYKLNYCSEYLDLPSVAFKGFTKERTQLGTLIRDEQWLDAMEVILYTHSLSDVATKVFAENKTILGIATRCNNQRMEEAVRSIFDEKQFMQNHRSPWETELIRVTKAFKRKNMEKILNSPDTDWDYIWRKDKDRKAAVFYEKSKKSHALIWNKVLEILKNKKSNQQFENIYHDPSLLAMCIRDKRPDCFDIIFETFGLDYFKKKHYETALYTAVVENDIESVEKILHLPGVNVEYVTKQRSFYTALSESIQNEALEIIQLFIERFGNIFGEKERADILNNAKPYYKTTALHMICALYTHHSPSKPTLILKNHSQKKDSNKWPMFKMIYDGYPSDFRKDALLKKDSKGKTALDYCVGRGLGKESMDIKMFIEQQMQ